MPQIDTVNRRVVLAARPHGLPTRSDFRVEEVAVPVPAGGQVCFARSIFLSIPICAT